MAGINPTTDQWDPNYNVPGASANNLDLGGGVPVPTGGGGFPDEPGGQGNSTPTTTTTTTTPTTTDPNAPPTGMDPDSTEVKYDASGFPIAIVYKYTANGHKKGDVKQDLSSYQDMLKKIGNVPGFDPTKIVDITKTQTWTDLQALIDKMNDPNTTTNDYQTALAQVAKMMGIGTTADDYTNFMKNLQDALNAAKGGLTQETSEQQGETSQYLYAQRQDSEAEMRKQVDAIMSGSVNNSVNAGILKSNEFIRGMNSDQIKASTQLVNMHLSANLNAFNAELQQYSTMYQNGTATAQTIVKAFQDNRMAALQGYALEIDGIYKQNQTYLATYQTELAAWKANADNIYQMINTQLGIDANAQAKIKNDWDAWYTQQQAALSAQLSGEQTVVDIFKLAGTILGIVLMF